MNKPIFFCFWYPGDKRDDSNLGHPTAPGWYMVSLMPGVYSEMQRITPCTSAEAIEARALAFIAFCGELAASNQAA